MGLFSSASKPPAMAQMPTCQARLFQKETEEMSQITRVANQVTTETFNALNSARALGKNKSLSSDQRAQVSNAKELLELQGTFAKYTTQELTCFNKTYDQWGNELAQKYERQGGDSRALLNDSNLRTKDGYSPDSLRNEVVRHRGFVTKMASDGMQDVVNAVQTLNNIAAAKGAPRVPDVSATWAKAANPASW
ncbi:hypothetical protein [Limnobacter parvus]|uniref:Phasin domain-containing protein n=1 Tax=Limnobacter parvus TaxID=2939690 RepID=A0ABT1XIR9_9BURK|nr:hypothetical protein [Limnobacter parvus]MCR2746177.1 hypothetical protein [Limnobacter parvus]